MVFSGFVFLIRFLPIFLLIYFAVPAGKKYTIPIKNVILLVGSLFFYAYGEPVYVFLMMASILLNFVLAVGMDYYYGKERYVLHRKGILLLAIVVNVGVLFYFKYYDFFVLNLNILLQKLYVVTGADFGIIPMGVPELPIGISFYTFQILSYVIDVYYRKYSAEKNIVTLGTYISMFPQLIAGPIVQYPMVRQALKKRKVTPGRFDRGLKVFIVGLGAKVIIANQIGTLWTDIERIGYESISTPLAWLGAFAYSFQIYYDFFGYSLMAIGLGMMLGFKMPVNFNNPYVSRSVTEFWQRWHITLGSWFRQYVYIPLGGNREGKGKMVRNLFVVWLLTGLWHGADWNFVIWGMGFFVLQLLEKFFLKKWLDKQRILSALYMLTIVPVSWIIFAISDIKRLGIYLSRLFPFFEVSYVSNVNPDDYIRYGKTYSLVFFMAVLFCVPMVADMVKYLLRKKAGTVATIIIFVLSMYFLSLGLDNPFLYYRF